MSLAWQDREQDEARLAEWAEYQPLPRDATSEYAPHVEWQPLLIGAAIGAGVWGVIWGVVWLVRWIW